MQTISVDIDKLRDALCGLTSTQANGILAAMSVEGEPLLLEPRTQGAGFAPLAQKDR